MVDSEVAMSESIGQAVVDTDDMVAVHRVFRPAWGRTTPHRQRHRIHRRARAVGD
jgi:hypothetical protein